VGGTDRGRPRQAQLRRTTLGEEAGRRRRLRAGDPVRRADRRQASRAVRPCRPGLRAWAVHQARARRGRVGSEQARPTD